MALAHSLRQRGLSVETDLEGRSLKAQFKRADKLNVRITLVLGADEIGKGVVQVKDMEKKDQKEVSRSDLAQHLSEILQS